MLVVSFGLHVIALRWLSRGPVAPPLSPRVTEFTLVYPKLVPPIATFLPTHPRRGTHPADSLLRGGTHPADLAPAAPVAGTDLPGGTHPAEIADDAPRASRLLKPLSLAQLGSFRSDRWKGETQNAPAAGQSLAQKNAEGTALVQGWLIADGARSRVSHSAVHPYFTELAMALKKESGHPPAFSAQHSVLSSFAHDYFANAAAFGKTGISASAAQGDGRIVALVELRQTAEGAFQASLLLESSGSPGFDAHVLQALPKAANHLRAPLLEEGGLHATGLRSVWAFEGTVRDVPDPSAKPTLKAKNLPLALLAPIGLLSGRLDQVAQSAGALGMLKTVYDCTPHLVAVY